jgi:lipopolysaccharide biosynthesis glycosyltransferase
MLLKSLNSQPYNNFDLLFITDEETKSTIQDIPELKKHNVYYHIVASTTDPVDASMQKLKIYEWENISEYKNILFLDADIIVVGSVGAIFESESVKNNIIYSAVHNKNQLLHKTVYHCLIDYTEYQLHNFSEKNITAFNAGQFFFKNTSAMKSHFENINNFISEWDGRYFFEQSFINYYFNLLEIADTKEFDNQFKFVSIN